MQKSESNRHMAWRRLHPQTENTLSPKVIERIAAEHDIPPEQVSEIGRELVYYLSYKFMPLGLHPFTEWGPAGEKKRSEIIRLAKRARTDVVKIQALLEPLRIPATDVQALPISIVDLASRMESVASELLQLEYLMEASEKARQSISDISAGDKRRDRDDIRPAVVASLMRFWKKIGRQPTITTNAALPGNPRSGAFVNFATDIILELTDPPAAINDETLRSDVREANRLHKEAERYRQLGLS